MPLTASRHGELEPRDPWENSLITVNYHNMIPSLSFVVVLFVVDTLKMTMKIAEAAWVELTRSYLCL